MLTTETWDDIPKHDTNKAANILTQKLKETMDIVAPVETKSMGKKQC